MRVERVTTRAGMRAFVDFPVRLHPAGRYVPAYASTIEHHHRFAEFYLVRDDAGRVVGRTGVHRDDAFDAKVGPRQLFGHTDFVDDDAVLAALLGVVQDAAAGRPLFGPVALTPMETGGVITSGFHERGFLESPWNPAYYPAAYERLGFARRFESDTWLVPVRGPDAGYVFDDARIAAEDLRIRYASRADVPALLPMLRDLLNDSFAQLGYATPVTLEQLRVQTEGLEHVLDERLLLWLERAGRPVAFIVVVPDISEYLMTIGGRLGLLNQLRFLAVRGRYRRDAVLISKGVVPGEQGRGYLTLLARELHRNLAAGGYRYLRSTFVERDNPASAAQYRRAGGRPLHGFTFYERG
ncbi:GNAT family N-acetyltransferase [Spirilliplanes yamanashiensis]|uniref:N-acetyltransferase domain-containing protein n=1 Tax=Spirilliplanes yamanashiensis TaxID=42233 RepID=A0A8J3YC32_9ACTN|nr:hypothetical protein [Spirilliplanes yamanashiensis]MDP9818564.1 hypothetical protein [Spirilliplanes yamanashiensis]GIJ05020.1 hypothetical protein Sya03_43720 [Spirilliplanes yamanashiensis]